MKKLLIFSFLFLFLVSSISAGIICSPDSITKNFNKGEIPTDSSIYCSNDDVNNSVMITTTGDYFSTTETVIGKGSSKTIPILFDEDTPVGTHIGLIIFENLEIVQVNLIVGEDPTDRCRLIELPHTTTYRIKQGETGSSSQIKVRVSSECPSTMTGMIVTEQTQMSKPMYLQGTSGDLEPGDDFSFSIGLDAEGVQTGKYQNFYIISGSIGDIIYQKSIALSTIVTLGTSPVDSESFNNLPTCTLDSDMKLNETYKLICNNDNPNIQIDVPYNEFFEGKSVEESEGKIEYSFKPKKTGVVDFIALFKFKGFYMGEAFIKEVRIMQGDIPIQGTKLIPLFYQEGIKKEISDLLEGDVTILVMDDNSNSVVSEFKIYLNGLEMNNTFNLKSNKEYELIIDSEGYLSTTLNFTVDSEPLTITISPSLSEYNVGQIINITSNINDTSFLFDGYSISGTKYKLLKEGNFTIKAIKSGYTSIEKIILIKNLITIISKTPNDFEDWKKGKKINVGLSEETDWIIEFQESYSQDGNKLYRAKTTIYSGSGNLIQFEMEEYGIYQIVADGSVIKTINLTNKKWFTFQGFKDNWFLWVGGIAMVLFISYLYLNNKGSSSTGEKAYMVESTHGT